MKCKELQIFDWIKDKNGFQWQIIGVGDDYAYATFEGNEGDPWEFVDKDDKPQPILLTPEILEKNGWTHHATYGNSEDETLEEIYMLYQNSFEVVFYNKEAILIRHFVSDEDDGYDKLLIEPCDNGCKPMYVHTLQHALRLYGLDELADNFKL